VKTGDSVAGFWLFVIGYSFLVISDFCLVLMREKTVISRWQFPDNCQIELKKGFSDGKTITATDFLRLLMVILGTAMAF
jgi:hypothetical protein